MRYHDKRGERQFESTGVANGRAMEPLTVECSGPREGHVSAALRDVVGAAENRISRAPVMDPSGHQKTFKTAWHARLRRAGIPYFRIYDLRSLSAGGVGPWRIWKKSRKWFKMSGRIYCRGVAQPGSAPALGAGGRRFKSSRPDQQNQSHTKVAGPKAGRL